MARVRGKHTRPELVIRKALHARGFRYRLHAPELPGQPDIVLPRYRTAILVHGCFWHGHDCRLFRPPRTRAAFWGAKVERNQQRDAEVHDALRAMGWRCGTVWECAIRRPTSMDFADLMEDMATWIKTKNGTMEWRGVE